MVSWANRTLAHKASENGHVECLRVLIQNGLFELHANDVNGHNPIEVACHFDQINIVRYFIQNVTLITPELDIRNNNGQQFICKCIRVACFQGHAGIVALLSEHLKWEDETDALLDCIHTSLIKHKFITAKLLINEMSNLISEKSEAFQSMHIEKLWSASVKTSNKSD